MRLPGFLLCAALVAGAVPLGQSSAPPNVPADITLAGDRITVHYDGAALFEGQIRNPSALRAAVPTVLRHGEAVDQVLALYAREGRLEVAGTVTSGAEGFPCESDRAVRALPVVRHSSGLSRSRLNQAVYDRRGDWVLSVDDRLHTSVVVSPLSETATARTFALDAVGTEILLRFRPRFYQQHRGLRYFEPWTYAAWSRPVVGWCSWFAFSDEVTDRDIRRTADVMSEVLVPYGYEYLQIDDGYQRGTGLPELWLTPNAKFPEGMAATADYIRSKGLKPGIWTNATFSQTEFAAAHPEWFVRDGDGGVVRGNWIDHPVDATAPGALDALVRPIYRGLRGMGWEYFKLDALRHLRYEGYNSFAGYFERKHVWPGDALRQYVTAVREEVGRDHFLLACWGVRPELVGLVDGCRLGTDGFSYAGLAQYNSFNNVVWRNDPDHIELSEQEAWRSTMVTSLTGSLFLLTDKPERYRTPLVEPARRAAPVLVTVPGQLYDVDPSRSSQLARVDSEVSGRDPKPFDAGLTPSVHLYLLEINRPFESWVVLGRTGGAFDEIRWEDLGLDPKKRYTVFEFWERRFFSPYADAFVPGAVSPKFKSQVFIIRERLPHPQVVATSRHITGGGVDLLDVGWKDGVLSGRSRVVAGEPYEIFMTEGPAWRLSAMRCSGGPSLPITREGTLVTSGCRPAAAGELAWQARFERPTGPPDYSGVPVGAVAARPSAALASDVLLFSSFRGNGEDGLHLAWSDDGYTWTALANDRPFLEPKVGGKLMRDPQIIRGPDGTFHMVWTTQWDRGGIGYASSKDLVTWSAQRYLDVMKDEPASRNAWAPELFYDEAGRKFVVFWSSTVPGRFPATDASGDDGLNHRIYFTSTRDFLTFSPTKLLFDPGFSCIDATIARDGTRFLMFFKDETLHPPQKNLKVAAAASPEGPWGPASAPLTGQTWAEGPSAIRLGDTWFVYFDRYLEGRYGLVTSSDLLAWRDETSRLRFPKGTSHGSVIRVPRSVLTRLLEAGPR
jgi:hypothetical protein